MAKVRALPLRAAHLLTPFLQPRLVFGQWRLPAPLGMGQGAQNAVGAHVMVGSSKP